MAARAWVCGENGGAEAPRSNLHGFARRVGEKCAARAVRLRLGGKGVLAASGAPNKV